MKKLIYCIISFMLFLPGIEYSFGQCDGDLIETDFDVTSALEESGGGLFIGNYESN
jgi:hypothetical protein